MRREVRKPKKAKARTEETGFPERAVMEYRYCPKTREETPLLMRKFYFASVILMGILSVMLVSGQAHAASCETVAKTLNTRLQQQLNEGELSDILATLNETKNRELPARFVTKKQAKNAGWSPGQDLWAVTALKGKSIGGDVFGNFEQRLQKGNGGRLISTTGAASVVQSASFFRPMADG